MIRVFGILAAITTLAWAAYEWAAIANRRDGDTITEITQAVAVRWRVVPMVLGMLAGHLFSDREALLLFAVCMMLSAIYWPR